MLIRRVDTVSSQTKALISLRLSTYDEAERRRESKFWKIEGRKQIRWLQREMQIGCCMLFVRKHHLVFTTSSMGPEVMGD